MYARHRSLEKKKFIEVRTFFALQTRGLNFLPLPIRNISTFDREIHRDVCTMYSGRTSTKNCVLAKKSLFLLFRQ